ncbi:TetR/AcrR family transcriptional regulator [Pseudonocardia sp. TRM90224]|uniref:TetR/AcrR family transcriptional regulator n=1 Tax=Pseudonocardia sp. TRM90224 TaxID=2812678 RepID=UPI001E3F3DF1|nr:TetR/AcrR family transcriptional regulator [Pseudonocardia sp. TRM90224]
MSSKRSAQTRGRVLDAARALFNEQGTAAVSTNHIAAGAGISPGNLYYHFTDKQAIIRELFGRYAAALDDRWRPQGDADRNLATLGENLTVAADLAWEHRFFQRELLVLLRADPELRDRYTEVYRRRLAEVQAFAEQLVEQGVVVPPRPPRTINDLAVAVWLISESWLPFLDLTGDPDDPDQVARGRDLIMVALEPYLTEHGRRQFT